MPVNTPFRTGRPMRRTLATLVLVATAAPFAAHAQLAEPVDGARIEPRETEAELRFGRLFGGSAAGADGLALEIEHGLSKQMRGALLFETSREPGGPRRLDGIGIEAVHSLGRVEPLALDVALYGEYRIGLTGPDELETKLLLQHSAGAFDSRLNLVFGKELAAHAPIELSYAASADWAIAGDELRLGAAAFGGLGTTRALFAPGGHYAGPIAKLEIEHIGRGELEIETGWLRAFGEARKETDGQARLVVSYGLRF